MPALGLGSALQSRVARRVVGLFIGCTLVPMLGLAVVTTRRTNDHLKTEAEARIRYDVKTVMMEALARMEVLDQRLEMLGATIASGAVSPAVLEARVDELLPRRPDLLAFVSEDATITSLGGTTPVPDLGEEERRRLNSGQPLIAPVDGDDGARMTVLFVPIRTSDGTGTMVASMNHEEIFGLDALDPLPPDSEICVFDAGTLLACSSGIDPDVARAASLMDSDSDAVLASAAGDLMARSRTMPLDFGYGARPWKIVMVRPQAIVRAPISHFLWDFWRVLALSLLVISLLAMTQVRRHLQPLVALTAGTRRLAQRDFTTPVHITSRDEFEELGDAFNALSAELQKQFAELEAFSIGTLETLARTIDAKSHWTAGHSERVTELSVALALEMQLPDVEVDELRRGGLVHDIGKLATPVEILDKPGRLTDEEMAIMQDHAQQGVHILEPIAAFRSLLPIVGQHHERWDGTGYPNGLAGTAIARTARVLAVADVFDAMRSDRPYREGMPLSKTVDAIRKGTGTHFDPEAVDAFLRLITRTAPDWAQDADADRAPAVTQAS